MMEACVNCRKIVEKATKDKIFEELREFIKDPDNYYVIINPNTQFYKLEKINK